jgi:hypothetical protein
MCGRVIIHLNEKLDRVQEVGCLIQQKIKSYSCFQFKSLLNDSERMAVIENIFKF